MYQLRFYSWQLAYSYTIYSSNAVLVPPSINPISNVTTAEGRNTVVRCDASGIPPPKLMWKKRGSSDVLSNETIFLGIKNISRSETGWYQCIATNGFGNPASQQVYINVHCKLLCDQNECVFIEGRSVFLNLNLKLKCLAGGILVWYWLLVSQYNQNKYITINAMYVFYNSYINCRPIDLWLCVSKCSAQ